jgi:DNA-binding SARP family transcriptional activator/predicted ATPase/Flp pilus assembly protein TadD
VASQLRIRLLGEIRITLDGRPLAGFGSRTAGALLVYLACHDEPQPRRFLADFFWDERDPKQAAANLRTVLALLRKTLAPYLLITRETVAFDHGPDTWLDAAEFEAALASLAPALRSPAALEAETAGRLRAALALYRGDFLQGFYLHESRGFEEWAALQRERLRRLAGRALQRLGDHALHGGDYVEGIPYVERLLALDPYDETAWRQMLWLLARDGRRNEALQRYRALQQLLADDLGVEPLPATVAVYERVHRLELPPPCDLPPEPTPFVGRVRELAEVERLLLQTDCRLLTLAGPGGIGKTRLALEAARRVVERRAGRFLDGVFFVPLAHLQSGDYLATTLGDRLGASFEGAAPAQEQLLAHLRHRELLLVLDNFEQLAGTPAPGLLLAGVLAQAPAVKLLVTSRERLRLVEECIFEVPGMAFPAAGAATEVTGYSAVQLFLQQARRVQPSFAPTAETMGAIARICQVVQGMPLGIELAASGVSYASCAEILEMLQKRLDLTFGSWPNRPERHQSLQAVFEHSWALLAPEEQAVARRLAAFAGAFDMEAAVAVAVAAPAELISLYDKSFLQRREPDRFDLHPLLRQFLAGRLAQNPAERDEARQRHLEYYERLLGKAAGKHNMERYFYSLRDALERDSENIIAATAWAAERRDFAERRLVTLVERLNFYFRYARRDETWKVVYERLIAALASGGNNSAEERVLAGHLSARIAYADIRLHAYGRARQRLEAILPEARALESAPLISACLRWLALLALREADFDTAFRQAEAALEAVAAYPPQYHFYAYEILGQIALGAGDLARTAAAYEKRYALALEIESTSEVGPRYEWAMGTLLHRRGQLVEARRRLEQAVALARTNGEQLEIAACLERLAYITVDLGDIEGAEPLLTEAAGLTPVQTHSHRAAIVARAQGWRAECEDSLEQARVYYEQSLALLEKVGDQPELPFARVFLGRVCARLGAWEEAERQLQQALQTVEAWAGRGWLHAGAKTLALTGLGILRREQGDFASARATLEMAKATAENTEEHYFGLQAVVELALLLAEMGDTAEAEALAAFARRHLATVARDKGRLSSLGGSAISQNGH